jgi:hypothetical protein
MARGFRYLSPGSIHPDPEVILADVPGQLITGLDGFPHLHGGFVQGEGAGDRVVVLGGGDMEIRGDGFQVMACAGPGIGGDVDKKFQLSLDAARGLMANGPPVSWEVSTPSSVLTKEKVEPSALCLV